MNFLELTSYGLYLSSERERKICRRMFNHVLYKTLPQEFFTSKSFSCGQGNVPKTLRMSVNSCCFAHITRRRGYLSPPPPLPNTFTNNSHSTDGLFPTHRTCFLFMKTVYVWRMISCSARVWRLRWVSPVMFNVRTGLSTWRVLPLFTLWIKLNFANGLLRSKCGSRDLNVLFFLEYHSFARLLGTAFIYVT